MKILISGATGLVGTALHRLLSDQGHQVITLKRNDSGAPLTWQPDKGQIRLDPETALDGVINLSGANIGEKRWSPARKALILQSRLDSTRLLANTLISMAVKPKFFLSASAIGYYGDAPGTVATESSGPGSGFLADIAKAWEQAAQPAIDAGVRTVLMRTGVVLSPRGGALQQMLPAFRLGLGGPIGNGGQILSWVSLHELVNMIRFLIDRDDIGGPVNLVAPGAVTSREFAAVLGRVLKRPAFLPLPAFMVKLLFGEMGQTLLLSGIRVEPARLQQAGYTFLDADLAGALKVELTSDAG